MSIVPFSNTSSHQATPSGRIIAIAHRVKARMNDGIMTEALPTKVLILTNENKLTFELATERDELDFVFGRFPIKWSLVEGNYEAAVVAISTLPKHHVLWKKGKGDTDITGIPPSLIKEEKEGKKTVIYIAHKFATAFVGLAANDTVLMVLGGSGDNLAYALSSHGESIDARVFRLPGHTLKKFRGKKPADQEARDTSELETLITVWKNEQKLFHYCDRADRERILVASTYHAFKEAQGKRMECAARLRQQTIGRVFMTEGAGYPEGQIEDWFDAQKANSELLDVLQTVENKTKTALTKAVNASRVWQIFEPIEGVGPSIAGGIIAAIGDIRRFQKKENLIAFCGLHSLRPDGQKWQKGEVPTGAIMARQRRGQVSNWNRSSRQSLFLLGDQFNRRPESEWGKKLLANKQALRERHPEVVTNDQGKKRYNDGHIHKLAVWMTLRQFLKFLHREWWKLEGRNMLEPDLSKGPEQQAA
jgi:transposase